MAVLPIPRAILLIPIPPIPMLLIVPILSTPIIPILMFVPILMLVPIAVLLISNLDNTLKQTYPLLMHSTPQTVS